MIIRITIIAAMMTAPAIAHDGHYHATEPAQSSAEIPLPLDVGIGGPFSLFNQYGETRTEVDPDGRLQLLFFGYANCAGICPTALSNMAEATDILAERGVKLRPVLITIDPKQDTIETLGPALAKISPEFIGLTGPQDALEQAYKAFRVESRKLFTTPQTGDVYAHGGFVYLLDGGGNLQAILPPIMPADQIADIVERYSGSV